tara:strand:+ start:345 stop:791 length:447 start_codon:yes stop_codon:yes gene_type:complete
MAMIIRKYHLKDQQALLDLLKLNTPKYFSVAEQSDFIAYLKSSLEDYFVVELRDEVVGCGGVNYFLSENLACISWDIIHPKYQNQGIGKVLLKYRIDQIFSNPDIQSIVVRTSQHVSIFYEKAGFQLIRIVENYWALGYDLYEMRLKK